MFSIMYATDKTYAYICAASMISMLENNKSVDKIYIYLFSEDLSAIDKNKFYELVNKYGRTLNVIESKDFIGMFESYNLPNSRGVGYSNYVRLYVPEILLDINKIIYMDCDTIVLGGLQELYDIEIETYACAAACDWGSARANLPFGRPLSELYFNSGVMVINMKYCREMNLFEKSIGDLKEYDISKTATMTDQDIINYSFHKHIKKISIKYNVPVDCRLFSPKWLKYMNEKNENTYYSDEEINMALRSPVILHYCLSQIIRPWYLNSNDKKTDVWKHYFEMTPWHDERRLNCPISAKRKIIMFAVKYFPEPLYAFLRKMKEEKRFKKMIS